MRNTSLLVSGFSFDTVSIAQRAAELLGWQLTKRISRMRRIFASFREYMQKGKEAMRMDIEALLATNYQKIALLHEGNGTVLWHVRDDAGKSYVLERIHRTGLPLEALQALTDQRLPRVYFAAEDAARGCTYLVEEFLNGETLADYAAHHRLTEARVRNLFVQLCDALAALHDEELVHRDIKSSNILVDDAGIARIIDFDTVTEIGICASETTQEKNGTAGFAAPEQYEERLIDERTDIYALGVTMRGLLGSDYKGYLNDILAKCTEFDPENRYPNVAALKAAIQDRRRPQKKMAIYGKMRYPLWKTAVYAVLHFLALVFWLLFLAVMEYEYDVPFIAGDAAWECLFLFSGVAYAIIEYQKDLEMRFLYQLRWQDVAAYSLLHLEMVYPTFFLPLLFSGLYFTEVRPVIDDPVVTYSSLTIALILDVACVYKFIKFRGYVR